MRQSQLVSRSERRFVFLTGGFSSRILRLQYLWVRTRRSVPGILFKQLPITTYLASSRNLIAQEVVSELRIREDRLRLRQQVVHAAPALCIVSSAKMS